MRQGSKVSIYWHDVKKYHKGEKELCPTPMYTEGTFIKKTKNYILVKNPETINFGTLKNHPENKPKVYALPFGLIQEIKEIT